MEFTAMDALAYRSLGADEYAQRRSEVIGFAKELPEDATVEQAEAIDAELGLIEAEDERRSKLVKMEQRNMVKVIGGEATPVAAAEIKEEKMERAASLGEHFVQFRKDHKSADNRYIATPYQMRSVSAGDPTPSTGVVATQFDKEVVRRVAAPLTVLDLFPRKTISEPVYTWTVYKQTTGSVGVTSEGSTKNKLTYEYEQKSATLQKVTGFIKMTEELFWDAPYVADAINGDLVDDLWANRQYQALASLLSTSGIGTASVSYASAIDLLDAIIDEAADIEDTTHIAPNAVIVTPALWKVIRKAKNTLNEYMAGNPFAAQRYNALFEMQFAKSADLTANHILIGAFENRAVELCSKADGIRVDSTNSNDVDFEKNLVSIRAEAREIVACKRPACFCDITVSASGATGATS